MLRVCDIDTVSLGWCKMCVFTVQGLYFRIFGNCICSICTGVSSFIFAYFWRIVFVVFIFAYFWRIVFAVFRFAYFWGIVFVVFVVGSLTRPSINQHCRQWWRALTTIMWWGWWWWWWWYHGSDGHDDDVDNGGDGGDGCDAGGDDDAGGGMDFSLADLMTV